jgi:hypothetical protein
MDDCVLKGWDMHIESMIFELKLEIKELLY